MFLTFDNSCSAADDKRVISRMHYEVIYQFS